MISASRCIRVLLSCKARSTINFTATPSVLRSHVNRITTVTTSMYSTDEKSTTSRGQQSLECGDKIDENTKNHEAVDTMQCGDAPETSKVSLRDKKEQHCQDVNAETVQNAEATGETQKCRMQCDAENSVRADLADPCSTAPSPTHSPEETEVNPVDEILGLKECVGTCTNEADKVSEVLGGKQCFVDGAAGSYATDRPIPVHLPCEEPIVYAVGAEKKQQPQCISEMDKMPPLVPWPEQYSDTTQRVHLGVGLIFAAVSTFAVYAILRKHILP